MSDLDKRIVDNFGDQMQVIKSYDNMHPLVLRLRFKDLEENPSQPIDMFLKEMEDMLLNELALKGFPEITKVYTKKANETVINKETGAVEELKDTWVVETDGTALAKVLSVQMVDATKTSTNDIIEILRVLGIEAVRKSLINELRNVLKAYGIYVNYRHVSTLCDVMTQRGKLTSITRHGINRVETGPLRKCSFEETVEILLEAAAFSEVDSLKGITENIILGQLAPYGTGTFGVFIDYKTLSQNAQARPESPGNVSQGGFTPIQMQEEEQKYRFANTPMPDYTPVGGAGGTSYYGGATPAMGSFSPGFYNAASPGYASPAYPQSPGLGQSPVYRTTQSPIYTYANAGNEYQGGSSPGASPMSPYVGAYQSPVYNAGAYSGSPAYSPGAGRSQSPSYSPGLSRSPGYSPAGNGNISPFINYFVVASPSYSPTNPNFNQSSNFSPSYSPTSPGYRNTISPKYNAMVSPRYSVDSGNSGGSGNSPGSPAYNPSQVYIPSSPAYNPSASPAYQVTDRPAYNPATAGHMSPMEDDDEMKDDEKEAPRKQ